MLNNKLTYWPCLLFFCITSVPSAVYYMQDFEKHDLDFTIDTSVSLSTLEKDAPLAACNGNRGLRLYNRRNFISKEVMWQAASKELRNGFYFECYFRVHFADTVSSAGEQQYCGIFGFELPDSSGWYSNSSFMISRGPLQSWHANLHMRKDWNTWGLTIPEERDSVALHENIWYKAVVFLKIQDHMLEDSLFLNNRYIGAGKVRLSHAPEYLGKWSIGFSEKRPVPILWVDFDDISISDARLPPRPSAPQILSPEKNEYLYTAHPVFKVMPDTGELGALAIQVAVDSSGKTVADSLFPANTALMFHRALKQKAIYTCAMRYHDQFNRVGPWTRSGPWFVAADSSLCLGQQDPEGRIILVSKNNGVFPGDTLEAEIHFTPRKDVFFMDLNLSSEMFSGPRSERYGVFNKARNLTFSFSSSTGIFYKSREGYNRWEPMIKDSTLMGYPYSFFLIDKFSMTGRSGKTRIALRLDNTMEPGFWTLNAYTVHEKSGDRFHTPSLFFVIKKQRSLPPVPMTAIAGIAVVAVILSIFFVIRRKKKRVMVINPMLKRTAEDIRKYLMENFQNPDLCNDSIAKHVKLSVSSITDAFQIVYGKSPLYHLREIRVEKGCELLKNSRKSVSEVAFEVGFNDPIVFQRNFQKLKGINPTDFRNF